MPTRMDDHRRGSRTVVTVTALYNTDSGWRSLAETRFDMQVPAAVAALVVPRVAHCLRATIPPDTLATLHTG